MLPIDTLASPRARLDFAAGFVLAAVPWLNPLAPGPSPTVVPWIVSFACGLGLWSVAALRGACWRPSLLGAGAALLLWALVAHQPDAIEPLAWAGALLLMALAASLADAGALLRGTQTGIVFAAALSAGMAALQYFGAGDALAPVVSQAATGEAYANLRQPNQFATLCAIGLAMLLWPVIRIPLALRVLGVVLLAAASAASVSRTGLVQVAFVAALAACWGGAGRRERVVLALAATFAYFAASWALPELLQALTGQLPARTLWGRLGAGGDSCSSRVVLWGNVLHLITLRPWTGWGLGELDYAHFTTLYPGARFCDILDNAHNLPLQLAVELGVPAAVAVCAGLGAFVMRGRPWAERAPQRQLAWALLALVALHSLLEYPLWYGPFQITCGLAVGMLTTSPSRPPIARVVAVVVIALLAVAATYAGWDYARISQIYLPAEKRAAAWRDDPLAHAQHSLLFGGQARFAALTLQAPSRANAAEMLPQALALLHYSPEPRVIERAIEAAVFLQRDEEAAALLVRYRAAFPREARAWLQRAATAAQD